MASTTTKRTWAQAMADAEAFKAMFPPASYQRWEFGGSLRRRRPEVSDIEHVILPAFGDVPGNNLFGQPERRNLLFYFLDELEAAGNVSKHWYGDTGHRWGERYRGVDFRGFNHEIFMADPDNFGCILMIRTGPAEFSERMVTRLKAGGMYRQGGPGNEGYVVHVASGERVPVRDEAAYFTLLGMKVIEPEARR